MTWRLPFSCAMGIVYGAMLALLAPTLLDWFGSPTALVLNPAPVPEELRVILTLMGAGILLSDIRDLYAALGLRGGGWPWPPSEAGASRVPTSAAAAVQE